MRELPAHRCTVPASTPPALPPSPPLVSLLAAVGTPPRTVMSRRHSRTPRTHSGTTPAYSTAVSHRPWLMYSTTKSTSTVIQTAQLPSHLRPIINCAVRLNDVVRASPA